jgi:phospholipase C
MFLVLCGCGGGASSSSGSSLGSVQLNVQLAGGGGGTISSNPAGINCGQACSASFRPGTQVTLTETTATNSNFLGWEGGCSGNHPTCTLTVDADQQVTATFSLQNITALNHIIFLSQENRGFDHYFGELRKYWADNGYADQSFDGLPQYNPSSGPLPHYGPPPTNPGCDPTYPPPHPCKIDNHSPAVSSYELITQCVENLLPSWNTAHVNWDIYDPMGHNPATLNGFLLTSANYARTSGFNDKDGLRAMGGYTGDVLNYYYFMASNFGTSDRWFSPVMTRTDPNRQYLIAATSQGYAYPVGSNSHDQQLLTATTIFQELQDVGVSWKIYVNPVGTSCVGPPYDPACLVQHSYVRSFEWGKTIPTTYPKNIGTIGIANSDWDNDLANDTLPQVAQIETATDAGLDEHPSDPAATQIQLGASYVSSLINGVMTSSSWQSSIFILTYDESGGFFDHISPQKTVSPDGIKPQDLLPGDVCTHGTGPTCDFVYTGYRVPLIVVSPYAKKNYVSHHMADTTAILKLIETRFKLPSLTKRDAAQMDMTEFLDFAHPAWLIPPNPPAQNTNGACYLNKLP